MFNYFYTHNQLIAEINKYVVIILPITTFVKHLVISDQISNTV